MPRAPDGPPGGRARAAGAGCQGPPTLPFRVPRPAPRPAPPGPKLVRGASAAVSGPRATAAPQPGGSGQKRTPPGLGAAARPSRRARHCGRQCRTRTVTRKAGTGQCPRRAGPNRAPRRPKGGRVGPGWVRPRAGAAARQRRNRTRAGPAGPDHTHTVIIDRARPGADSEGPPRHVAGPVRPADRAGRRGARGECAVTAAFSRSAESGRGGRSTAARML
jgi:hypothetical protein